MSRIGTRGGKPGLKERSSGADLCRMSQGSRPLCFTCGLPAQTGIQFNRMPNGQVCPACRERLLEAIPPALPAFPRFDAAPSEQRGSEFDAAPGEADWDVDPRPWPPPGLAS